VPSLATRNLTCPKKPKDFYGHFMKDSRLSVKPSLQQVQNKVKNLKAEANKVRGPVLPMDTVCGFNKSWDLQFPMGSSANRARTAVFTPPWLQAASVSSGSAVLRGCLFTEASLERLALSKSVMLDGTDMVIVAPDDTPHRKSTLPVLMLSTSDGKTGKQHALAFVIVNQGESSEAVHELLSAVQEVRDLFLRDGSLGKEPFGAKAQAFLARHGHRPAIEAMAVDSAALGVASSLNRLSSHGAAPIIRRWTTLTADGAPGITGGWARYLGSTPLRPFLSGFRPTSGGRQTRDLSRRMCVFHVFQAIGRWALTQGRALTDDFMEQLFIMLRVVANAPTARLAEVLVAALLQHGINSIVSALNLKTRADWGAVAGPWNAPYPVARPLAKHRACACKLHTICLQDNL
jgi:hypothetical protein